MSQGLRFSGFAFDLKELTAPFRRSYAQYLGGTIVRQALLVLGGYSIVWALRIYTAHKNTPIWWLVAALLAFDSLYIWLETGLNGMFARRISFPLFARLRTTALRKVLGMPLEWHQRETSGALVAKVNNGVGRVVQTSEAISRELCPSLIRTAFTLIPLLIFGAATAPILLAAMLIFGWLTVLENRRRWQFRRGRHENYVRDSGIFSEYVQSVQPVMQFGQAPRLLDSYGRLQQSIVEQGVAEVEIAYVYGWRKNATLSIAKRLCQALWIWQMQAGRIDAALIMYLNMLTEELLASFWGYAALLERIYEDLEPARMLLELLVTDPAIGDQPQAEPMEVPERLAIDLVNVQFSYGGGKRVFERCNLSIEDGTILGIVGRSGSGKTTLQHLLSRIFDIEHGQLLLGGTDIRQWPLEQLRGVFSCVAQGGGAFFSESTMLDTIRFARPEASVDEVQVAAR